MDNARFTHIRTQVLRWSQQRLADELGMARNSITRMETGVMPIERRTELSLRWLMYSECNIVEQPSQPTPSEKDSSPALPQPDAFKSPIPSAAEQVGNDPLYVSMFSEGPFLSDLTSAQVDEVFSKFVEVAGEFSLVQNAEFIKLYIDSGYMTWFNRRYGRALAYDFSRRLT